MTISLQTKNPPHSLGYIPVTTDVETIVQKMELG